jgi:putative flippase GtrA
VIRDFYTRFRVLIHEVTKFGVVGVLAFIITLGGTYALNEGMGMSPTVATALATVVATVVAYVGNRYWAFKHRRGERLGREGLLFLIFNGIGLLVQTGAVAFVQHVLGYHRGPAVYIGLVIGVAVATVFRLFCYHRWVFNTAAIVPPATEQLEPETTGR